MRADLRLGRGGFILRISVRRGEFSASRCEWDVDRELVERAQRGDESAFATIAAEIGDRLHGVAYHVLRDPDLAADAAQQGLIEMWRKLPQLRDPDRLLPWAIRIVVRAAYAEAGRRSRWRIETPSVDGSVAGSDDLSTRIANRDQLERGFAQLSLDHRTVLVLKHLADLSNSDIASVLEISEGTVRSRLHYGLEALRGALAADRRVAT